MEHGVCFFLTLRTWPFRFYVEFLVQISAGLCISYSSYCNDHILEECSLEKKGSFILQSNIAENVWHLEFWAARVSLVRQQRAKDACYQPAFFFYATQDPNPGNGAAHIQKCFPMTIKIVQKKIPHRHTQDLYQSRFQILQTDSCSLGKTLQRHCVEVVYFLHQIFFSWANSFLKCQLTKKPFSSAMK